MRKSLGDIIDPKLKAAMDEFRSTSAIKNEVATDVYNLQTKTTQAAIDKITATLRKHATGYVNLNVGGKAQEVKVANADSEYLGFSLFYLAVESVKDMAFVGIRLATFRFPPTLCVSCGGDVISEKTTPRRKGTK